MRERFQILAKVFSSDMLTRAWPFLLLMLGGFVLLMGFSYPSSTFPRAHEVLMLLAQVILVGGLVGTLTNSLKYIGIFKEAVADVVHGKDFLQSRSDLPELWKRVTSVLCQEKFPQLADRLHGDVLANFLPAKKDFYYSNYFRECTLSFEGEQRDIVTIHEEIEFDLHPARREMEIPYTYRSWCDSRTPREVALVSGLRLFIDDVDQGDVLKEEEYEDEFGGKGLSQSYLVPLSGQEVYKIRRHMTRRLQIDRDPVIEFSSDEFILGCTVKFRSATAEIVPVFQSVGTDKFHDKSIGRKGDLKVYRTLPSLMFPKQGYILFVQRQQCTD
jgi:hypothetical protein